MINKFKREAELFYTQLLLVQWSVGPQQEFLPGLLIALKKPQFFYMHMWDTLRDLVPFVQFKKPEKYSWRGVTFSEACNFTSACDFTKSNTPPWVFFTFFKWYKWYQIVQSITFTCIQSLTHFVPVLSFITAWKSVLIYHCGKSVRIWSFSGPYFLAFGYSVSLRIQSECEKIRTRKTTNTYTFHAVAFQFFLVICSKYSILQYCNNKNWKVLK